MRLSALLCLPTVVLLGVLAFLPRASANPRSFPDAQSLMSEFEQSFGVRPRESDAQKILHETTDRLGSERTTAQLRQSLYESWHRAVGAQHAQARLASRGSPLFLLRIGYDRSGSTQGGARFGLRYVRAFDATGALVVHGFSEILRSKQGTYAIYHLYLEPGANLRGIAPMRAPRLPNPIQAGSRTPTYHELVEGAGKRSGLYGHMTVAYGKTSDVLVDLNGQPCAKAESTPPDASGVERIDYRCPLLPPEANDSSP